MSRRETAWRVLVHEIATSSTERRGEGDRAASYVVSPLGLPMNRVLLVGELDLSAPAIVPAGPEFVRGRLADPTGGVEVSAGSFQPRAQRQLRSLPSPATVLLVGKARLYRGQDGGARVSVAPEGVRPIGAPEYRECLAEAAESTLARLQNAYPNSSGSAGGASTTLWRAVDECLRVLTEGSVGVSPRAGAREPTVGAERRVTIRRTTTPTRESPPTAAERAEESAVLDLVDELADPSPDGYADQRDLLRRATASGLPAERAERILARLVADGALEEPIVGKFRRA